MSFQLEKNMLGPALEYLPGFFNFDDLYAFGTEVPVNNKTADIGFVPIRCCLKNKSEINVLSKLNQSELWLLAHVVALPTRKYRDLIAGLESNFGFHNLVKALNKLDNWGLIATKNNGDVYSTDLITQQIGPSILVELKLSRWDEAYKQAFFYLSRADLSCVVMDGKYCNSVNLDLFSNAGIGLFFAWEEDFQMILQPRQSVLSDPIQKVYNRLKAIQDVSRRTPKKWKLLTRQGLPYDQAIRPALN